MLHIRAAKLEDVNEISYILASSWKTAYRGIVDDGYLDALKKDHWVDFLTEGLNSGNVFSRVIENNQEIIGAAILSRTENKNEANLISFYLLPDKIGQGFGHTFYSAIETQLKDNGFFRCVIDVLENNTRAIGFYKAHGFYDTEKEATAVLGEYSYVCKVLEKLLCCGIK